MESPSWIKLGMTRERETNMSILFSTYPTTNNLYIYIYILAKLPGIAGLQ